ncbi:uncharacterized protein EI90DRAFT_3010868 [Cantharellus anzutake]|uniref:uncharacterized protein n=1 Tax=Cantharellus anzutake TaxID=1750568 RepID=UPI0019066FD9|nr:uncharacterized protein EI90DRAFT_3010868 [Cantharellus anzutake]KAF8344050.1 hypothetical protein EI90DRAFT_3010868 [Cantharellus anzutake]
MHVMSEILKTLGGNTGDDDEIELATSGLEIPMDGGTLIGPLLSRIRALIVRIRKSPGAKLYLRECCAKVSIKPLELMMYGNTRWGSWLILLNRFIELWPAIMHFIEHADRKDSVPKAKGRTPKYSAWRCAQGCGSYPTIILWDFEGFKCSILTLSL